MKKSTILLLFILCLGFAGCGRDADVNSFMSEWNSVTNEISKSVENGNVDQAQKTLDAKKDSLRAKWVSLKNIKDSQVSEDSKKKLEEVMKKSKETLLTAVMKGTMKIADDKSAVDKMQNLMKEYTSIISN